MLISRSSCGLHSQRSVIRPLSSSTGPVSVGTIALASRWEHSCGGVYQGLYHSSGADARIPRSVTTGT